MSLEKNEVETMNKWAIGTAGNEVVFGIPPRRLSRQDALLLAAWLVSIAERNEGEFATVLEAVRNT